MLVKGASYRDRDYAFGQVMLTLRTKIGLTQAGLADFLGVSRRTVGDWEAGNKYPNAEHLNEFITLPSSIMPFQLGWRHRRRMPCGTPLTRRFCSMKRGLVGCSPV